MSFQPLRLRLADLASLVIALLLVVTLLLRLWGIKQGLPYSYNVDEATHGARFSPSTAPAASTPGPRTTPGRHPRKHHHHREHHCHGHGRHRDDRPEHGPVDADTRPPTRAA